MRPFNDSIRLILEEAFLKLEYHVEFINDIDGYSNINISSGDIVLFIMTPELFINKYTTVYTGPGRRILWILEPISTYLPNTNNKSRKYFDRKNTIEGYLKNGSPGVDDIWTYSEEQCLYFNHEKIKFVPIGIADCMVSTCNIKAKAPLPKAAFLGSFTGPRKKFFNALRWKVKMYSSESLKIINFGYTNYTNNSLLIEQLSALYFAIDVMPNVDIDNYIRWHRIMTYIAAGVVVMTDSDLSRYGFIHGKHYLYFKNYKNCAEIIGNMREEKSKFLNISKNAMSLVLDKFKMECIIEKALSGGS